MNRLTHPNPCRSRRSRNPRHRAGFSFAEVMFAVMLLGLGFIMVAAIFPVAIRQQTTSMEDTSGVAVAKRAAALIQQMGTSFAQYNPAPPYDANYGNFTNLNQDDPTKDYTTRSTLTTPKANPVLIRFQVTATTHAGAIPPYRIVRGDLIQQTDRRLAWVPVAYASKLGSSYATVYLVAVQSRANDQFTDGDRNNSETDVNAPFYPQDCYFKLVEGDTFADTLVFTDSSGTPQEAPAAAEGAFVWVADDNVTAAPAGMLWIVPGGSNGRYYRLGVKRDDLGVGVWELQTGYDMAITNGPGPDGVWGNADDEKRNENLPPRPVDSQPVNYASLPGPAARGLLVGRGRERDPSGNYTNLAGNAMPIYALPPVTVRIQP